MKKIIKNIFTIFTPLMIGAFIALICDFKSYKSLISPPLAPPSWLFPIMWSIIYLLMGISYYLLKKHWAFDCKDAKTLYYIQLIVNALWSIIFFSCKWYFIATIWIILLDILVFYMIKTFRKYFELSGKLNYLYFAWCLFATYLTAGVYFLN